MCNENFHDLTKNNVYRNLNFFKFHIIVVRIEVREDKKKLIILINNNNLKKN